jgi:hypothetical protein
MSLPDWATHVAVDFNGLICAFDGPPLWSDTGHGGGGVWVAASGQRFYTFEYGEEIGAAVARLLCVEIPRVPAQEENDDG